MSCFEKGRFLKDFIFNKNVMFEKHPALAPGTCQGSPAVVHLKGTWGWTWAPPPQTPPFRAFGRVNITILKMMFYWKTLCWKNMLLH